MEHSRKRLTTEQFIQKAREKHGNLYEYDKVEYNTTHKAVAIRCKKHGLFYQTPHNHLLGCGCPICSAENRMNKGVV